MELTYTYIKHRKNFGRQPMFSIVAPHMIDSFLPDKTLQKQYILRNPVHAAVQKTNSLSQHEVNTYVVPTQNQGMNHVEGGWPKDVHYLDEEATKRYRTRKMKEDSYVLAIDKTYKYFTHYINQNNAIELYQRYFDDMKPQLPVEKYFTITKISWKDFDNRPVSSLNWSPEDETKILISYANKTYFSMRTYVETNFDCYLWSLDNSCSPIIVLKPPNPCWQAAWCNDIPFVILGGLEDGRVCVFDVRSGQQPVSLSPMHLAHRDPVSSVVHIKTRMKTEFFSGSSDGQCFWWDIRSMDERMDSMTMSLEKSLEKQSISYAQPVSVLEFNPAFPTKFLCGTDTGLVINVNRKGKTSSEIMSRVYKAHGGPVKALRFSPLTSKMFLTCGDWATHIWSEELDVSPIITGTSYRYPINDACWAPYRVSGYMSISDDGKFRFWDLLRKFSSPILTQYISQSPLLKMIIHPNGNFVAIGDKKGRTFLLSLSEDMIVPADNDKKNMLNVYERDFHRERILENRVKEIRLKLKTDVETDPVIEKIIEEDPCKLAEAEYFKIVKKEKYKCASGGYILESQNFVDQLLKGQRMK